jgi:hypothetical protein
MTTNRLLRFATVFVCLALVECSAGSGGAAGGAAGGAEPVDERTGSTDEALGVDPAPRALTTDFARLESIPAGVAGGRDVVFVGEPLDGRVAALDRLSANPIGELPPPARGFVVPFILHSLGEGRVAVLDAGGFPRPNPLVPANPTIYEYEYATHPGSGFSARLVRTIGFSSVLIGFAEDFVHLDDGRYIVSDARLGSLWVVEVDGSIRPGIVPSTSAPKDAIPALEFCPTMPLIRVGGIPFLFSDSALPGVSSLAARGGTLFFHSSCGRGLYSVPLASLSDRRRPDQRAADIRLVSPQPGGIAVEELLGLAFNPFDPDDAFLYAADALQLRIIRVNVLTGARQVVADDRRQFDFPSSTAFLPPLVDHLAPLLVVSNQQERTTLTNDAIAADAFVPPFIVAKVFVVE